MTLSSSIEIRKAQTDDLAAQVQYEFMRRQAALLRVPEVCYELIADMTLGLSSEQNSFVNILSAIYVNGHWQPVSQVSFETLVSTVDGLLTDLSSAYQDVVWVQRELFEDDGVTQLAKRRIAKICSQIQVSDLYLKKFFPLRTDIRETASRCSSRCLGLADSEAAEILSEFDASQSRLNALIAQMMTVNEAAFKSVLRPYMTGSFNRDDLLAEAQDGFYRACTRFNPKAGASFYSVLRRWVVARVVAFIDRESAVVSVGCSSGATYRKIRNARKELGADGKVVRLADIAKHTGLSVEDVTTFETSFSSVTATSEYDLANLEANIVTPEEAANARDDQEIIKRLLSKLTEREAQIVVGRYGIGCNPKTLEELGETYGVSCEAIRQIQRKAEGKMANYAKELV